MAELATSSQIFQVRPTSAAPVAMYTASLVTEITTLLICNTAATGTESFTLYHDDDGTAATNNTVIYLNVSVDPGSTHVISGQYPGTGISIAPGGTLSVRTSASASLTFTGYGKTTSTVGNEYG